ncbi:hypothetical protein Tco_0646127 [Tanacetum coccineum]
MSEEDHTVLLRSTSSDNKDPESQISSPKLSSSGRISKSSIWNRLDRAFSGKRLSIKKRSPRGVRWTERDRVLSPRNGGGGEDEVLADGAPPEWALLLISCLLGLATGLCVAAFNRGLLVILVSSLIFCVIKSRVGSVGKPPPLWRQRSRVRSSPLGGPLEAASLPSGRGTTVYILPPPYLVEDGIG